MARIINALFFSPAGIMLRAWSIILGVGSLGFVFAGRPCADGDWRFDFGSCKYGHRNVFMYPASEASGVVCDPAADGSWPSHILPPLNLSCTHSCLSGSHVSVQLQHEGEDDMGAVMEPSCKACPAGKFSLGGGLLVSGVAGDWRQRWPVELQSSCVWRDFGGEWQVRGELHTGPTLRVSSPALIAGAYSIAYASWNSKLTTPHIDILHGLLLRAPGDGFGCDSFELTNHDSKIVVFILPGGCSPQQKSIHAANAGAHAVLLMSEGYQRSPRIPGSGPSDVGLNPRIPLFAIARENGELFMLALNRSTVRLNVTSIGLGNSTKNAEIVGCSPWVPDPSGRFVSSGDNSNHDDIISYLSLNVHLVRPGHLIFRYSVSAEVGFDGLTFDVDWNQLLSLQSEQAEYKEFKVNLTAGPHLLRWKYSKDFQAQAGRDMAWLQLIEVTGTSHADFECRHCHSARTHSGAGASHCNVCGQDEYLQSQAEATDNLVKCMPCPTGRWSRPGSTGLDSCKLRLPCSQQDVVTSYTPCENFERYKRKSWPVPLTCDTAGKESLLGTATEKVKCTPCQPHEHRPSGKNCEPHVITCSKELHAVRELVISHWQVWPKNFSSEVWILQDDRWDTSDLSDQSDTVGERWSLASTGDFAYIGNNAGNSNSVVSEDDRRFGDAILHFDIELFDKGNVSFVVEVFPLEAWGNQGRLLINNVLATNLQVLTTSGHFLHATTALPEGKHQITWVWEYHEGQASSAADQLHGMRLWNVTVLNAVGSGALRCAPCPPGNEVVQYGAGCQACIPGRYMTATDLRCQACPADNFSVFPESTSCRPCGAGLWSRAGSSHCSPLETVKTYQQDGASDVGEKGLFDPVEPTGLPIDFNVLDVAFAWEAATGGITGPFAVGGRQFIIGLFELVVVPGVEDSSLAHAWELLLGGAGSECARGADDYESLGNVVAHVRGVAKESQRGISVSFVDGEPCNNSGAARSLTIFFPCAMRTSPDPPARKDALGLYHLPQLSMTRGITGQCENVTLEWPTSAACPKCSKSDYTEKVGACGADGTRVVSFVQKGKCLGGEPLPENRHEECGDSEKRTQNVKLTLIIVVPCAVILAASCCCYAMYLHKKYAKFLEDV